MVFIRPYQESDFEACAHIPPYVWTHQYTHLSPATCHMLVDDAHPTDTSGPSGSGDGGRVVGYCIGCPDVFAFAERYPSYITNILSTTVAPPPSLGPSASSTSASGGLPATDGGLTSSSGPTTSTSSTTEEEPFWIPDDTTLTSTAKKPNPAALIRLAYDPIRLLSLDGSPRDLSSSSSSSSSSASSSSSFEGGGWRATMHIDLLPEYQRQGWGRHLIESFVRSVQASGADYGRGAWIGIAPDNAQVVSFYEKVGFRLATPPAAVTSAEDGSGGGGEEGINMVIDIPPKV
ncbi:acetyltransferase [Apiospora arundinis]